MRVERGRYRTNSKRFREEAQPRRLMEHLTGDGELDRIIDPISALNRTKALEALIHLKSYSGRCGPCAPHACGPNRADNVLDHRRPKIISVARYAFVDSSNDSPLQRWMESCEPGSVEMDRRIGLIRNIPKERLRHLLHVTVLRSGEIAESEKGSPDAAVMVRLQIGEQLMAYPVAPMGDIPIRGVVKRSHAAFGAEGAGHRSISLDARPDGWPPAGRHGREAGRTGAPDNVHQDRLNSIISGMPESNDGRPDLLTDGGDRVHSLRPRCRLNRLTRAFDPFDDVSADRMAGYAEIVAELLDIGGLSVRIGSAKAMVDMHILQRGTVRSGDRPEREEHGYRVLSAGYCRQQSSARRQQCIAQTGLGDGVKKRLIHKRVLSGRKGGCVNPAVIGRISKRMVASAGRTAGLEDVVAGDSRICFVDGERGRLIYYGYDVKDLAAGSTFEEVAYLLWYGRLPGRVEFDAFLDTFTGSMHLPAETAMILRMFPRAATPMEVLRTAVSSLGHWDPDSGNTGLDASLRKAIRLTERIPILVTAHQRLRNGMEPLQPKPGRSIAYNFLYTLLGQAPNPILEKTFDVALILHADHELNASTFAARVVAATLSDMYSSVTAAIGALKGPLHGGANEQAVRVFEEIGAPDRAEEWVRESLAAKRKVPGFGHRVYRTYDPRALILKEYARAASVTVGDTRLYEIAEGVERGMLERSKVYPNVDLWSGVCYSAMGIPVELFTPIFAISRVVGWTAHILEQWSNNRLIRPRAEYVGPVDLEYLPISQR